MLKSGRNPWQCLSSRQIYSNPWITVREDSVLLPNGAPGIYGVVQTRIATGVIALTETNEVYLVGQHRYPTDHYSWEIIEGGAERGEDPLVAAKRELREEAGIIAEQWEPLGGEFHLSNCISDEIGYLYLAKGLTVVAAEPEATEELVVVKVPLVQAIELVHRGEIKDAFSVIALLLMATRI